ncbi:retinoblastoma-binding protein 5-like [Heracleum sosnowskyi]|uniref:Retinoblastoma-binding protein 5-like n=1 Tax=Heracleum sosnowskyi TaxID=360622 RepID=A0AAD8JFL4_9APIA|nr:retinoblastoma-binding protein 5-like [Heracleum sosnowskyi]
MNVPIIDPLQGDFPEVIEEFLEHGAMKCIAFNRRGTLLAAGCSDGSCVIWDFMTRNVAKVLKDNKCDATITSVSWSKFGHRLLVAAADNSLTVWDVLEGHKVRQVTLQKTPFLARLHPGSSIPSICLVCPLSTPPMIVDLNTGSTTTLPISLSERDSLILPPTHNKFSDGSAPYTASVACFSKYGDLVYVGNSKGEILVIDHKSNQVRGIVATSGGSMIKNIVFSRSGQFLLTNSSDRTIRIYENLLPLKDGLKSLDDLKETLKELSGVEKLRAIGSKCLVPLRDFQDSVTRMHWKASCFSGDSEYVVGGSADKGEHKMYIWDRAGHLVKILEGPKEAIIDFAWHPVRPIIVSVSATGSIYIWAKDYTENWSAFFPDFVEIEENEEYVEHEDEFDLNPDCERVKQSDVNEDEEVDIMTADKDTSFSDSDMSQEELLYLPVDTCPDVPEKQDQCIGTGDSILYGSPLSEYAGQNGKVMKYTSCPIDGQGSDAAMDDSDTGGTNLKRKRKPTEKVLELQEEKKNLTCPLNLYLRCVVSLMGLLKLTGFSFGCNVVAMSSEF